METVNWPSLIFGGTLLGLGFVASAALGLTATAYVALRLPPDYLLRAGAPMPTESRQRAAGIPLRILRNILGAALAALGGMLSLPGIPGPGLLMLVVGLTLMDFPGKGRFIRWLVARPAVLAGVNRLRQRHGKPPLLLAGPGRAGRNRSHGGAGTARSGLS